MKSSLNRNLLIGFGISLLILVISSAASFISIKNLFRSADLVEHTNQVVAELNATISKMKDAETGQRGYLLTGKENFLEPYDGSRAEVNTHIEQVGNLTLDNDVQQQRLQQLKQVVDKRFNALQKLIAIKRMGGTPDIADLDAGKASMDSIRALVKNMIDREQNMLVDRTAALNRFSSFTPLMIIVAALLAILITFVFYIRVKKDVADKARLQDELEKKDHEIQYRIETIQHVATQISSGDFDTRLEESGQDNLGSIAGSLNKMAASLARSFRELENREWLQTGIAGLNDKMIGDNNMSMLGDKIMHYIANYTNSLVGAFYLSDHPGHFVLHNGYALKTDKLKQDFEEGEGLPGECARSKEILVINGINPGNVSISFASGELKPASIVLIPVMYENEVKAVIELGSADVFTDRDILFMRRIGENIGIALNTMMNRQRLQLLLEETQSQSEELMSQQVEMEQVNAELEAQAQQLQTSEEELKVQSEELIETNTLLEERAVMLSSQNELIIQKNAEIQRRSEELAMSTKYKSEFLANMSHELRTPLNSILLLSRLMSENLEGNLTPDQVQYAQVIQSSGHGLLQLIDEILDLSKIEAGKMDIERAPVLVQDVVNALHNLFDPLAKQNRIEWKTEVHGNVPSIVETDRMRLEQILKNLLSNAFKFTQQGYIQLSVSSRQAQPGTVCFVVKDSGIGINSEKLDLIFEAFRQEDGSTRRRFGGTGLGLSISRELAKLLGGEITVRSKPGEGSEFTLCIPVRHHETPEILVKKAPVTESREPALPEGPGDAGKEITEALLNERDDRYNTIHIPEEIPDDRASLKPGDKILLIIEDDIAFAKALLEYTHQKDYKGIVAVRGDVGIAMAEKYKPLGILLDIQLPVKNGWEVLQALKQNVVTRHIPVHIMSSYNVKKESLMEGAIDFINKPVAFEQLSTIFDKIDFVLSKKDKKVLIMEENNKHAKALAYYLGTYNVHTEIFRDVQESIGALKKEEVDCVILDIGGTNKSYEEILENIKKNEGLENMPVILFTGKNLTQPEEFRIRKYADAIVMKTANSYQRILDEVSLFLHMVQEQQGKMGLAGFERSVLQENVLKGKKILLADDDVRNIFSTTKALEKYGLKIIPAMDGKEALSLLATNPGIDAVLMDIMMPEMDGYESIRAIRRNKDYKELPIIAVTAKAMSGDREKCISAGASDYISKPVDMDQLVSLLRIWLYERGY